jgi:curved DNA-binding protein CbpA
MSDNNGKVDFYELLQVSCNAEPDTIHRVYRLLAQRFHPDNRDTGSSDRFHQIHEAYTILSDPERRARYDVSYHQNRQDRWRFVATGAESENDFEIEQIGRLTVLEALYTKRRIEPQAPALIVAELESLTGRPREHLEFTVWYLVQRKFVKKDDQSRLEITADGVEHLEENYRSNMKRRRLQASNEP